MAQRETQVRLKEVFSPEYKLITALPSWSSFAYHDVFDEYLDDIIWYRYRDILIDNDRYYVSLDSWLLSRIPDLERAYESLLQNYDPLSNYSMIEKEGTGWKEGEKVSAAKLYGVNKTSVTIPETKNSRYSTTYDDASTGRLESYTVSTPQQSPSEGGYPVQQTTAQQLPVDGKQGSELTESYKGNVTIDAPESDITADRGEERQLSREGNIGVTTSQEMLKAELDLRQKYSFINFFCSLFVSEMTIGVYKIGDDLI